MQQDLLDCCIHCMLMYVTNKFQMQFSRFAWSIEFTVNWVGDRAENKFQLFFLGIL